MLTLGQASCLVLGYKINEENRQKAKKQLQKCGLLAIHIREQDPFRPTAIGQDVFERDPFTFVTYPPTPTLIPTDSVSCNVKNDDQINFDLDNNNNDNSSNKSDSECTNNNDDNHDNNSNHGDDNNNIKTDNNDKNHKYSDSNNHNTEKLNNDKKTSHGTKGLAAKKRKISKNIVPFCKERLLNIMESIATSDKPSDTEYYNYQFMTAELQYEMMKELFPDLEQYCTADRLQYWVGKSSIWGPRKRITENGKTKYGRHLWIVGKDMREFLVESTDSITTYWDHLKKETDFITIGYARKSPTKENDASRARLLQLMVDKLFFRMKCEEVYVSPRCFADEPILERDSPPPH